MRRVKNIMRLKISKCCSSTFKVKNNGLWNYTVCDKCNKKCETKNEKTT